MSPSRKVCIIANLVAGHGKAEALLPEVKKLLKDCGIEFDLFVTQGPGHAETLAAGLAGKGYRVMAAMGGDGTLGEVLNGVLTAGQGHVVPLAAIPAGTGNDFITGNRLFSNWSESIEALLRPKIAQFDVMLTKDASNRTRYAVNSLGVGFDAYVCKRVAEGGSKRFGSMSYAIEVVRGLFVFKPKDMAIVMDGQRVDVRKAWLCAVMNSENLGGGMKITPGAVADDGYLHTGYLSDIPRARLIGILLSVFKGNHVGKQGIHISKGHEITIEAPKDYPCHLDGDVFYTTYPLRVELVAGAVPFVTGVES